MNRQTVIDALTSAGITAHQAEQVGYLYKEMGMLTCTAQGGYALTPRALEPDTIRRAAANPLHARNPNW
jgi:hypothetical protein